MGSIGTVTASFSRIQYALSVSESNGAIDSGGTISASDNVTNQGADVPITTVIAYSLSPNATFGDFDDVPFTTTRPVGPLAAGASNSASVTLQVPVTTTAGSYHVCAAVYKNQGINESISSSCAPSSISVYTGVSPLGPTERVNLDSNGQPMAGSSPFHFVIGPNGRYVAFSSAFMNGSSVWVRDRSTGTTEVIREGGFDAAFPSISADGRYVTYQQYGRLRVRDRQSGSTESVGVAGVLENNFNGSISANGRYIVYVSVTPNQVPGETRVCSYSGGAGTACPDVFLQDRQTGLIEHISVDSNGFGGDGASSVFSRPAVSADGRYIAFSSQASNLVAGDTNGVEDVFIRDRQTRVTQRVSVRTGGVQGNAASGGYQSRIAMNADGRYVAFYSDASNLVNGDTNGTGDIFVHDRQTGVTQRVSVRSGGLQASAFGSPSISADGRYVAFESGATNLVEGDTNGFSDIFVHDRQTALTERVSLSVNNSQANSASRSPAISADGRYVAFESPASNLVAGDTNGVWDVFVRDRHVQVSPGSDTDGDGLPDTWESQHGLNPLDFSDGSFDSDGDGATNLEEYVGGTAPQSTVSIPTLVTAQDDQSQEFRLVVPQGVAVSDFHWVAPDTLPPPPLCTFIFGVVSLNLQVPVGGTVTVAVTSPRAVPTEANFRKFGPTASDPTPHWYIFPFGSNDGDGTVMLTLTDGGPGDHDLVANGVIVDPGGLTLPVPISSGPSILANISTRALVGTGEDVAVGGFIISGTGTKQVLIRGFGPTLSVAVSGALANPVLELYADHDSNPLTPAILIVNNDDWGTALTSCPVPAVACGTPQDIINTGRSANSYAPTHPQRHLDAALLVTLPPGTYTATLRGANNVTGVGLVAVNDVDTSQTATLVNISTRASVGTGESVAVGGFIISGTGNKQVLLRGFGPTLSVAVAGAMANPVLELYADHDSNPLTPAILIVSNDDWGTALTTCPAPAVSCGSPQDILNTGKSADSYASTHPDRILDAALLVTLPPGTYTATLRGVNNGTGVGLVAVNEIGP
jgi:Tol biopolymer transport system component